MYGNKFRKVDRVSGVLLASGNAVGGYVVTERMLEMFKSKKEMSNAETIIQSIYVVAAVLFIASKLKRMSLPTTARTGIVWAGVGMLMATAATFFYPGVENFVLIASAILIGTVLAGYTAKKVEMTEMPEMIAPYNGMGDRKQLLLQLLNSSKIITCRLVSPLWL